MKINPLDVEKSLNNAHKLIEQERGMSSALRAALEVLLLLVGALLNRTTLNSKNSSKPPSSDPNRLKYCHTNVFRAILLINYKYHLVKVQSITLIFRHFLN